MSDTLYVWGVDVSTKRVAVAFHGPTQAVRSVEFDRKLRDGARLDDIQFRTYMAVLHWRGEFPPYYCFVEQPTGANPNPQLMYAAGVVQQAIYEGLEKLFDHPVTVCTIPVGDWKKRSVGHGNAGKEQVLRWAQGQGFEGECVACKGAKCKSPVHDESDALGVAFGGAVLLGRVSPGAGAVAA